MVDRTRSLSKTQPCAQLSKSLPKDTVWILAELGKIAVLMGEQVSPERLSLTLDELVDIPPDILRKAFAVARHECKWFPKPAEIFEIIQRNWKPRILSRPGE